MRNVCSRGRRCKFKHPSSDELNKEVNCSNSSITYEFCHDHQNKQCQRTNCRFIHGTHAEEEAYQNKKVLPLRLKYQYEFGVNDSSQENNSLKNLHDPGGRPVCYDFFSRENCHRGKKCKFFHPGPQALAILRSSSNGDYPLGFHETSKRARVQIVEEKDSIAVPQAMVVEQKKEIITLPAKADEDSETQIKLDEENKYLKRRVAELEKQVWDLTATNEVLLDQNAQFRYMKKGIASVSPPTTFSTAVAISPMTVVSNAQPRSIHFPANVQMTAQTGQNGLQGGQGCSVVAAPQMQVTSSVPHSAAIAQVINIGGSSGGTVETIQGTNQIVSHPVPNPTSHALLQQRPPAMQPQQMQPQPPPPPPPPQMQPQPQMTQQPTLMQGGQIVSMPLATHRTVMGPPPQAMQPPPNQHIQAAHAGSMGMQVPMHSTLVYTASRSQENAAPPQQPTIVNTLMSVQNHEMTLVADAGPPQPPPQANQQVVSSMPAPMHQVAAVQHYNSCSTPAIVQASTHQNSAYSAPMTSCIVAANNNSYSQSAQQQQQNRGSVRPVV